jgi:hypothetical protein
MARISKSACALAALAALGVASAAISCPTSAAAATSCLCTSNCAVDNDTAGLGYSWTNATYPPVSVALGTDTICATVVVPCTAAAARLSAYYFLGANGDIQNDGAGGCAPRRAARQAFPRRGRAAAWRRH